MIYLRILLFTLLFVRFINAKSLPGAFFDDVIDADNLNTIEITPFITSFKTDEVLATTTNQFNPTLTNELGSMNQNNFEELNEHLSTIESPNIFTEMSSNEALMEINEMTKESGTSDNQNIFTETRNIKFTTEPDYTTQENGGNNMGMLMGPIQNTKDEHNEFIPIKNSLFDQNDIEYSKHSLNNIKKFETKDDDLDSLLKFEEIQGNYLELPYPVYVKYVPNRSFKYGPDIFDSPAQRAAAREAIRAAYL